jgi:hypothetical protein
MRVYSYSSNSRKILALFYFAYKIVQQYIHLFRHGVDADDIITFISEDRYKADGFNASSTYIAFKDVKYDCNENIVYYQRRHKLKEYDFYLQGFYKTGLEISDLYKKFLPKWIRSGLQNKYESYTYQSYKDKFSSILYWWLKGLWECGIGGWLANIKFIKSAVYFAIIFLGLYHYTQFISNLINL